MTEYPKGKTMKLPGQKISNHIPGKRKLTSGRTGNMPENDNASKYGDNMGAAHPGVGLDKGESFKK